MGVPTAMTDHLLCLEATMKRQGRASSGSPSSAHHRDAKLRRGEPDERCSSKAVHITLRGSCRHQNALAQQVEAGPAVALPFEQLEPVDLAFGLSVAPGQGQGSTDRGAILLQTGGECLDGADAASTSLGQPGIEVRQGRNKVFRLPDAAAANQGGEPPRQGSDEGSLFVLLDPGEVVPGFRLSRRWGGRPPGGIDVPRCGS